MEKDAAGQVLAKRSRMFEYVYAHVLPGMQEDAAAKVSAMILGTR